MAMGLPIIVYKSLSGQEAHNAELLSKVGAGIRVKNKEELRRILEHLLKNSDDYLLLKKATEIMKRPEAPMDIARTIISKLS
jgi:UDP-N-acetylglucosamine:LPS N-acetylglucosamine transferase